MARARGNGEGTIYYRADRERWVAAVTLPDGTRRTHTATRQRDAQAWLTATKARIQQGQVPGKRQTFRQFMAAWLAGRESALKPSSHSRYVAINALHLEPALGRYELGRISPQMIDRYKVDRLKAGLSPNTVRMHLSLLSHALSDAAKWGLIARNPCQLVEAPRFRRKEMSVYDEEQVGRFLAAAAEDRLGGLYVLAVTTGMRQGEILGLRWEDIDWDRPGIMVRRSLWYWRGQFTVTTPKSGRARAITPAPMTIDALRRRQEVQQLERAAAGERWEDTGYCFTSYLGRNIIPQDLRTTYRRFLAKAGLPRIRFHDLRHTLGTLMLTMGEHPRVVQELLGHSTVVVTMDTYSHVTATVHAQAMQRVQARLSPPAATAPLPDPANTPTAGEEQ